MSLAGGKRPSCGCETEAEAWAWVAKMLATGGAPEPAPAPPPPAPRAVCFDDLADLYKVHRSKQWKGGLEGGSAAEYDSHTAVLIREFGPRPIREIRAGDIQPFIDRHTNRPILHRYGDKAGQPTGRTLSPTTTNKLVRLLKALFRYAVMMEWLEADPTAKLQRQKRAKKAKKRRARTLRLWELQALLAKCAPRHRLFLSFLAFTGLRRSEAARCRWSWLDLDQGELHVHEPKVEREEVAVLPLAPQLVELLRAVPEEKRSEHLFVWRVNADGTRRPVKSMRRAIASACTLAGVDPVAVSHHSFRHAFGSLLEDFGASRAVVRTLMRHDPDAGEMTDAYVEATPEKLRAAVERLADTVLGPPVAIPIARAR